MSDTRAEIERAVGRFFRAVDARDWSLVGDLLAERVETDYTSIFGGTPETVTGPDLVDRWQTLLPGFDATQHLLGPLVLDDEAFGPRGCGCNVRGYHRLGSETWMVAGWYTLRFDLGGPVRICGITIDLAYETGSRDLVEQAQRRAAG